MEICRFSGSSLDLVIDLGKQPLGNGFLSSHQFADEYFFQLQCGFNEQSKLLQLINQPDPQLMFHENYAFFSSTSRGMQSHFSGFADRVITEYKLQPRNHLIVEIGCNDGIFLKNFAEKDFNHIGVEPSGEVARMAELKGINVVNEFFDSDVSKAIESEKGKAKLIYAANVFCHIPAITDLLKSIDILLDIEGLVIFEDPYLGAIVDKNSYDQIYDEHVFFFSALAVKEIFAEINMELIDCEPISVHGGSMRYTLARVGQFDAKSNVEEVMLKELAQGLHLTSTFTALSERIAKSKLDLRAELMTLKKSGVEVCAYGATSKSTTIYNYCEIDAELIDVIFDNSPLKIGRLSPGSHIPIIDEAEFINSSYKVAFLGAWNHKNEIFERNSAFAAKHGKWLTHVPNVKYL
jgi:hypothetical protein